MSTTIGSNLGPWLPAHLRGLIVIDLVAVLVLAGACIGSSRVATLNDGIAWINLAVLALVLYAVSNGTFLLLGRKRAGARRRTLLPDLVTDTRTHTTTQPADGEGWVWLPGTRRAHRPDCALIEGKAVVLADNGLIRAESLQRCEVCGR